MAKDCLPKWLEMVRYADGLLNMKKENKVKRMQQWKFSEVSVLLTHWISLLWLLLHDWIAFSLHSAYVSSSSSSRSLIIITSTKYSILWILYSQSRPYVLGLIILYFFFQDKIVLVLFSHPDCWGGDNLNQNITDLQWALVPLLLSLLSSVTLIGFLKLSVPECPHL